MNKNSLVNLYTNPQPIPSVFNEGFSQYETIKYMIGLTNQLIENQNLGADEISDLQGKKVSLEYYLNDLANNRKLSPNGDFTGTWEGFKPSQVDVAITGIIDGHTSQLNDIAINVKSFTGVIGDGVADDTIAIQNCINLCKDLGYSINFGKHSYKISNELVFDGFKGNIYGTNANITSVNDTKNIIGVYNCNNIKISGLNLKNVIKLLPKDYYGLDVKGIYIATSNNVEVEHNNIQWVTDGISVNTCQNVNIHDNICHELGEEIIVINNCKHISVCNNEGFNHSGDGILLKSSKDYTSSIYNIYNNFIHDGAVRDLVPPNSAGIGGGITHNGEGQTGVGTIFNVHDNTILNTEYGVNIGNCQKAHITHNTIKTTSKTGICIVCDDVYNVDGITVSDILIDGNIVDGTSGNSIQVSPYGQLTALTSIIVSKNIVKNCYGTYALFLKDVIATGNYVTGGYGIVSITSGCFNDNKVENTQGRFLFTGAIISGNTLTGNTGVDQYCITATECTIIGNLISNNYMMGYYTACRIIGNKFYKSTAITSYLLVGTPGNYYGQSTLFLLDTIILEGNIITDDYGIVCVRNSVNGRGTIANNFVTINNGNINLFVGVVTAKVKIFNNTFNKKIVIDNNNVSFVTSDDTLTTHATFTP